MRPVDKDFFTCFGFGFVLPYKSLIELLVKLAGRIVGNEADGSTIVRCQEGQLIGFDQRYCN